MVKLRVKYFGPINDGCSESECFISFQKLTVFIGEQGSGKSTVAKLYSTFAWLEKAFFCGFDVTKDFSYEDFIQLCSNQLLPEFYFTEKTELDYIGDYCSFSLRKKTLKIESKKSSNYVRPQIMYMPSERNLVSVLDNVDKIQNLPPMLKLLQKEINKAKKNYLPKVADENSFKTLDRYSIKYDSNIDTIVVTEKESNVSVPLMQASSGLQSLIPLVIVTDFLSIGTQQAAVDKLRNLSSDEQNAILSAVSDTNLAKKMQVFFETGLGRNDIKNDLEKYADIYSKYLNSSFINIVEEPEQNLFPEFQKKIIDSLVLHANSFEKNRLVITTHSPYVLGILNNCIYAGNLTRIGKDCSSVIALNRQIPVENVAAYKIENGSVRSIISQDLKLISNSEIDGCSQTINEEYQRLEDIEFA